MAEALRAVRAAARLELEQLGRSRVLVTLVVLEAITFLVLVSLFGLTGSRAPTALIDRDDGPLARSFVDHLDAAHHSFALRPMSADRASEQISSGDILAIITIPSDFGRRVAGAGTSVVPITVDNVNEDLTGDVREAMPSAVTAFAADNNFPGVRVVAVEHDLIDHETGYVAYLVVSALALTAFVVSGILGAVSITREFETQTVTQLRLAPVPAGWLVVGKLLAASCVSAIAVGITAFIPITHSVRLRCSRSASSSSRASAPASARCSGGRCPCPRSSSGSRSRSTSTRVRSSRSGSTARNSG